MWGVSRIILGGTWGVILLSVSVDETYGRFTFNIDAVAVAKFQEVLGRRVVGRWMVHEPRFT